MENKKILIELSEKINKIYEEAENNYSSNKAEIYKQFINETNKKIDIEIENFSIYCKIKYFTVIRK